MDSGHLLIQFNLYSVFFQVAQIQNVYAHIQDNKKLSALSFIEAWWTRQTSSFWLPVWQIYTVSSHKW